MKKQPKSHRRDWVSFDSVPHPIVSTRDVVTNNPLHYLLRSSRERHLSQINCLSPVGNRAKLDYIDTYKNISILSQKNKLNHLEDSPSVAYLHRIDKINLNPEPFGIVRRKGPDNKIDIHSYSMGDVYANAFSEGLAHCRGVKELNLANNRLTENGCVKILQKLKDSGMRKVNLSENKIGNRSVQVLIEIVQYQKSKLKWLDIENTGVSDMMIANLCKYIGKNSVITHLNLARNNLGYFSANALKEMLRENSYLKRLDLHWNNFRTLGALELLKGLADNSGLLELDVSWNSLGRDSSLEVAQSLGKALKDNTDLIHLDISFNYFSKAEIEIFGSLIKDNHTLIGLHVLGNDCTLDSKGFVIASEFMGTAQQSHFFNRMFVNDTKVPKKKTVINCWICERWIEVKYTWTPGVSGEASNAPIYLHLECDNFEPELMKKGADGIFYKVRVVPQKKMKFFFSCRSGAMKNNEKKIIKLSQCLKINNLEEVKIVNYDQLHGTECDIKDLFESKARILGDAYEAAATEYEKIPWSISTSVFKDYKIDTAEFLNECFEFDWKTSKLMNFIKIPEIQNNIYDDLQIIYDYIIETYRTLSAYSGNELFCVTQNVLIDFLNQCKCIDNLFQVSDLGVNWNSANAGKDKGETYNAGNGLCRYEFMEIIVRIANDRFVRNKICKNASEALDKFTKEHLLEVIKTYDNRILRKEKIMVEDVDCFLKAHKVIFDALFKKFSGKKSVPGQKAFMSLEEFRLLCLDTGIVTDSFTTREIDVCFSQAMMTQVDIIYKKRHLEMSFVEFLEAICRAAWQTTVVDMPQASLRDKLEGIIDRLIACCPSSVSEGFVKPTKETYFKMMYRPKAFE